VPAVWGGSKNTAAARGKVVEPQVAAPTTTAPPIARASAPAAIDAIDAIDVATIDVAPPTKQGRKRYRSHIRLDMFIDDRDAHSVTHASNNATYTGTRELTSEERALWIARAQAAAAASANANAAPVRADEAEAASVGAKKRKKGLER